jgi:RNA polymerase sigma factor (sigma-70 family)
VVEVADAELVVRALDGDESAFSCLVARHVDVARRVAFLHAPRHEIDDVIQDAFVRAWVDLPRLRTGEGFRPWLVAIVANHARNRRRGADRREIWEGRAPEWRQQPITPDEHVVSTEQVTLVLAAVSALREHERDVVVYRYFLDLSEAETAQALGVAVGTVKSRLSRALDRLRISMGASE